MTAMESLSPSFTSMTGSPSLPPCPFSPALSDASSSRSTQIIQATGEDHRRAEQLMSVYLTKTDDFTYKEATAALSNIASGNVPDATPGLVQALLDYDADVCLQRRKSSNVWKMWTGKDQDDVRSNLFENATRNCSDDILLLLARHADQFALDQALPIAIMNNDVAKVDILAARGANATPLCDPFLNAVQSCSERIVERLLGRVRGACQSCRDQGLIRAAALGDEMKVKILLEKDANMTFDKAAALRVSIRNGKIDAARVIVNHQKMRPHVDLLDLALGEAYKLAQYEIVEACLRAGATGETTDATLLNAVEQKQRKLVGTLIQCGVSVEYQGGAPVISAVRSGQPELLQTVLRGKPSKSTLDTAITQVIKFNDIQAADKMIDFLLSFGASGDAVGETLIQVLDKKLMVSDEDARHDLAFLLLKKGGADINFRDGSSLELAAAEGWIRTLRLLIQYRPSIESLSRALEPAMKLLDPKLTKQIVEMVMDIGSNNPFIAKRAIIYAAKYFHLDILEDLFRSELSVAAVQPAFDATVSSENRWITSSGLPVVQLLLDKGASGPSVDNAFCQAVVLLERDAIELLVHFASPEAPNKALGGLIAHSRDWHSIDDRNLWIINSLLEWGANGETVNLALLKAVEAFATGSASEDLIDTLLLADGADVNFQHGQALVLAIKGGSAVLLEKLASHGANPDVMTRAFSEVILTPLGEDAVLDLINVLIKAKNRPDFKATLPNRCPPIVGCLTVHPNSAKLVRRLAELGCDMDAKFETQLCDVLELANPLSWALLPFQDNHIVSTAAIEALIKATLSANSETASVNFTAPRSHTTPLILAATFGRGDLVKSLIKAGAKTYSRDYYDRSPLFYASRIGNLVAVNALLKAKCKKNDGSLHEAARNLHSEVVTALIKGKHDANFPSSKPEHDGRTPLQEMAYRCDGARKVSEIELTIEALETGKVNYLDKWQEKNALFLAFRNAQPYTVTYALVERMWRVINDETNIISEKHPKTGETIIMSPTVYLKRYKSKTSSELEQLLRTKKCVDRYYAPLGMSQPAGAVGMPPEIEKEDRRRRDEAEKLRRKEQEHQEKLRREWEENQLKEEIDRAKHEAWRARELEKTAQKVEQATVLHQNQLHQRAQMSTQEREALMQRQALAEQSRLRDASTRQGALQRELQLKLDYEQQVAQQKLASRRR